MTQVMTRKRYRVKNKVRFAAFIVISLLLLCAIANTALGFNDAAALTEQTYFQVQVEPGDTLWSIADEYMPDDMDPREAVHLIIDANDIDGSQIYVGQELDVPVL